MKHRMKQKTNSGFTIIEVSFFLAISGLMAVGLLAGAGATINSHRYRDSVVSLQAQLQHEFTKVENIQNSRLGDEGCNATASVTTSGAPRGTTDCVILGRLIAIEVDKVTSYPVIARAGVSANEDQDDLVFLKNHIIKTDASPGSSYSETRKWGNTITYPSGFSSRIQGSDRKIYLLVVRSPKSGVIYSFSSSENLSTGDGDLSAMVVQEPVDAMFGRSRQVLCVKTEGLVRMSSLGVAIEADIANPNGILITGNDTEPGICR